MASTTRRPSRNTPITEGKLLVWSPCDFRYQLSVTPMSSSSRISTNFLVILSSICHDTDFNFEKFEWNSNSQFSIKSTFNAFLVFFFLFSSDFNQDGQPDNISFMIKRVKVHGEDALNDPSYRFTGTYGVEEFLELFSGKRTISSIF